MKKERYYLIDLFKFLAAILVIMIHTLSVSNRSGLLYKFIDKGIYSLAVPFFFVVSGFLLGNKLDNKSYKDQKKIIFKYVKRLIIPFVFWLAVSLYFQTDLIKTFNLLKLFQHILFSPWCAMWYIGSLIFAVLLMIPFLKKDKLHYLLVISIILFLVGLLSGNYYFITNDILKIIINDYLKIFLTTRNGLFEGLYFVLIGVYVYKYNSRFSIKFSFVLLLISYVIYLVEIYMLSSNAVLETSGLYITSLVLFPSILLFLSKFKSSKYNFTKFAKFSSGIYFTHQFINYFYKFIFNNEVVGIKLFILVLLTTFILLFILYKIDNKYINKLI